MISKKRSLVILMVLFAFMGGGITVHSMVEAGNANNQPTVQMFFTGGLAMDCIERGAGCGRGA